MNDVRKALIWGIENPPREYTIEEWYIITEFARHVAEHSKESLIEDFKEAMGKPCVVTDTFEEDMKKEYEQLQRGMKEFAKGKIGRFGEEPLSISVDDVVYKEPIDTKPIHRINIDNIKAIDCQTGDIHYEPKADNIRPIKDDRVVEVRIEFKCADCKYKECEVSEYPCNECEKSSKFEKRKTK